jgi:hypothetical protein
MRLKKFIPLLFLFTSCVPSSQKQGMDTAAMTEISSPDKKAVITHENGFADIQLSIASVEKKDSSTLIHISSIYNGKNIGFNAVIPDKEESGFGHGMILSSTGAESDNFLALLAAEYHVPLATDAKFCKADTIAFVDLEKMGKTLGKDVNTFGHKMKLFFESDGETEADYKNAEVYFNIDKENNTIGFNEKDQDYRNDLIWFLTEKK